MTTLVSINNKTSKEMIELLNPEDKQDKVWIKELKDRYEYDEDIDKHPHFTKWKWQSKLTYSVLFIKEWRHTDFCHIMLAHELLHAVSFVMSDMMDIVKENEALAYQHSYLMESVLKRLSKHKKKSILY